jgi:hypothetical protein
MAKREVKRSFTFEQQREEINLLADDTGDRAQLDTTNLSVSGRANLVDAINEVIESPVDDIFIDEINNGQPQYTQDQRLLFADTGSFKDQASFDKPNAVNPEGLDYSRVKYDFGDGATEDRLSYNPNKKELRAANIKGDVRNRNADPDGTGQYVFNVNTDVDAHSQSRTARVTGRLRTAATSPPVDIQKNLIKLEEKARIALNEESLIQLATAIDTGASINVTNNKKILYVSANDENASDLPTNDGSNINKPFKSIERALIEASKRSYVAPGEGTEQGESGSDLFENFTILLFPGEYIIDNRPGVNELGNAFTAADISEEIKTQPNEAYATSSSVANELYKFNPPQGGLIVPRGTSIVGLDLRKTLIRPKYVPDPADDSVGRSSMFRLTGACYIWQFTIKDALLEFTPNANGSHHKLTAFEYANYEQLEDYYRKIDKYSRLDETTSPPGQRFYDAENLLLANKRFIAELAVSYVVEKAIADGTPGGANQFDEYVGNTPPGAGTGTFGTACVDDVADILVELGYNLSHGGNNRVAAAAQIYIDSPLLSGQEREETVDVFAVANILSQFAIRNYDILADQDGLVAAALAAYDANFTVPLSTAASSTTAQAAGVTVSSQSYDFSISPDTTVSGTGYDLDDNTDPANCANVVSSINVLWTILIDTIQSIIDGSPAVPVGAGTGPTGEEDYNQRIEENRIVGFVQNKYLSDTVASASPYVFNISLRSVWGLCGLLSDGAQSTGLRSMVLAQYTGISLQRDDRAFILNGVTTDQIENPDERHSNSLSEYREDWRHFHIKSRNNSFLQIVSVFAVGQADHFTVETGADHSITNSNSNFGNQSLIAVNHRTEVFKQDNGAFITGLVPPRGLDPNEESSVNIYNIDYGTTLTKYDAAEKASPAGFRKIYVKVGGESLIKEGQIPEYYSLVPGTSTPQAELILDDVNYLMGKRTYSDGYPEAIYANLPKNFDDSTLSTFAARLREINYIGGSPDVYDPRPEYSEGKITGENPSLTGTAPGPAAIRTSLKNFVVLAGSNTDQPGDPGFVDAGALTNLSTAATHFGNPTTGSPTIRSSVRLKIIVGNNLSTYKIVPAEGPIAGIAVKGLAVSPTLPTENVSYVATAAATGNQVQYTYNAVTYANGVQGNDPSNNNGAGAQFEILRCASSTEYAVRIINTGVTYNVGDSFTIPGSLLGGVDGEPEDASPGNNITIFVTETPSSGTGIGRGSAGDFKVNFVDSVTPANTEELRIYCTDATLRNQVFIETNELATYDSIEDVDYIIASGGFDAKYSFSLRETSGDTPWENLGSFSIGTVAGIPSTVFRKIRILGGSGFSADAGFNLIKFPGTKLGGVDNNNDFTVTVTSVGGATISTLNYNDDGTTPKRRYYGWEFARTIDGEYYGRLVLLVDDERVNGITSIVGIPGSFAYTNNGETFDGYSASTTVNNATATTRSGLVFSRDITSVTNLTDGTFRINLTNPADKPEHPFFKGNEITINNVSTTAGGGASLDGTYKVLDRDNPLSSVVISVPDGASLPTTWNQVGGGSTIQRISESKTIPIKATIGNIVNGSGQILAVYPFDYVIGAAQQDYTSGWTKSGSNLSFDDRIFVDTGTGTPFLPQYDSVEFQIDPNDPNNLVTRANQLYGASSLKEAGYLQGSALGVDYTPYDESISLEENTFNYPVGDAVDNVTLSLLRRITQRVDTDGSNTLDNIRDSFEFNDNIVSSLYVKRIQDSRASNGNSELIWRAICKIPKDGYNNIKLRAPEVKFILHIKDPALSYDDDTMDYPFVYDSAKIGLIRSVEVVSLGSTQTDVAPTTQEFFKSVRRGGSDAYVNYDQIDNTDSIGADNLVPSGATFDVTATEVIVKTGGSGYSDGDRLTLPGGTVVIVREAVTTYPKTFYVQKVEPVVEYEYNVRDGYYLLTLLDANVYEELVNGVVENNTKKIVYGKQRLIGLEELDGDGIPDEINHLKQDGSDLIEKNRLFIQEEAAGYLIAESQPGQQFAGFVNPDNDRCKRDVGYLLNALVKDLRLGGNNNIINTAQYYFSAGTQQFIETELPQTLATFGYAKHLAIAAMRNWQFYVQATSSPSSSTYAFANASEMDGIVEGMAIYEATGSNLPSDAASYATAEASLSNGVGGVGQVLGYVGEIDRSAFTITVYDTQDRDTRIASNRASNTELVIKFVMNTGMGPDWNDATAYTTKPVFDNSVIIDYDQSTDSKCDSVRSAIDVLYTIFSDILNANQAVVSSGVIPQTATFEVPTGAIQPNETIRIFGGQNPAFNGEEILITAGDITTGAPNDTIEYQLDVNFTSPISDNILWYKSAVVYTEPTKASYNTKEVLLEGIGYNQNINYLYPETDLDNPKWNPKPSVTVYRKDVGNTVIRDNTLLADGYERISQYSITAESTKKVLNEILNANGYAGRTFAEIDLQSVFGAGVTTVTDTEMQAPYGTGDTRNEYGVSKSAVLEFTAQNVPIFTDRCITFNKAIPVSFYRPSIIRASSHTWEYVGFGPGNYSTALPQFQDITLTQQETINSQTSERGGGFVASSGTNSVGDFYIGNQIIDAKGNQSNTLNFPRVKTSAENRLIDYTNLDSLASNSSTASFNPSSFSAVLTNELQAIQEAQRNSFKSSNIESSILTAGTLKINNKISISNNVFENEENFPVARQDKFGFTRRAPINWFNNDSASVEYKALADSFISPTDLSDWANVNSLIPSTPVDWVVNYKPETTYNNSTNVGDVDINDTLTKSVNFRVTGINPIDERWYDATNDTLGIPLGSPIDDVNNTNLATYNGRAGQIFVTFPTAVNAAFVAPTNIWKPIDNTWTSIDQEFGNAVNYIRGTEFVVSYYITDGKIIYSVSTLDSE